MRTGTRGYCCCRGQMHENIYSSNDPDSVNTISMMIHVGGKQAVALVDSGSNSTFMNLQFALKTNLTILKDKSRSVAVVGGGKL